MIKEILKETTDWEFPNHTYALNHAGKLVAYIKENEEDVIFLKKAIFFSKSKRKFRKIKDKEVFDKFNGDVV